MSVKDPVCLHAAASGPATWDPLRPGLAELGFRLHTPVLLGHRGSARRWWPWHSPAGSSGWYSGEA